LYNVTRCFSSLLRHLFKKYKDMSLVCQSGRLGSVPTMTKGDFLKRFKVFVFNSLVLIFTSVVLRFVGMYFGIYISNKIGIETLGVFQLIMSVYMFGITFACSGINIAVTKVVSEELAIGCETTIKRITRKCIIISLITGILASFILLISSNFIVTTCLHGKVNLKIIYLICLALPFISMSSAINGYFTAIRKAYKNACRNIF